MSVVGSALSPAVFGVLVAPFRGRDCENDRLVALAPNLTAIGHEPGVAAAERASWTLDQHSEHADALSQPLRWSDTRLCESIAATLRQSVHDPSPATTDTAILRSAALQLSQTIAQIPAPTASQVARLRQGLEWMSQHQVIHVSLDAWMGNTFASAKMACALAMTAHLERSLADVCRWQGGTRPLLFRDLLLVPELVEVFGPDTIFLLRVLLGPPAGLNLRNIIWHGFLTVDELAAPLVWFLVALCGQLGQQLKSHSQTCSFVATHASELKSFAAYNDALMQSFPATVEFPLDDARMGNDAVLLLQTSTLPFSRYFGSILLLPQLEHALRIRFVETNNCPGRLLTAEPDELFTTFTEILSTSSTNLLVEHLPRQLLELLLDLLVCQTGPRIRDRVSHGDADVSSITDGVARALLNLVISLQSPESKSLESYRSLYHPLVAVEDSISDGIEAIRQCSVRWTEALQHGLTLGENAIDFELLLMQYQESSACADIHVAWQSLSEHLELTFGLRPLEPIPPSEMQPESLLAWWPVRTLRPSLAVHNSNHMEVAQTFRLAACTIPVMLDAINSHISLRFMERNPETLNRGQWQTLMACFTALPALTNACAVYLAFVSVYLFRLRQRLPQTRAATDLLSKVARASLRLFERAKARSLGNRFPDAVQAVLELVQTLPVHLQGCLLLMQGEIQSQ
ncbi:hypothetical protein CAOG_07337 [Capsaspora owczarzaki ATCC 30864]|uniref:DUF4209 domain-containing protein n=1 Tax=Capsaspora owczarzaki (strain ATCC 30864) TaxID=595528 RepID=A0A0D2W015_CAPO3|nr:hypothetical protein CAOG_07337 [Capsaspora owczarzaki ATCC 30864]KJE97487.1 hypothetical protein CAOG_007337 [Capsaspora owczarzaki ATCC 30864]|eukprot:XP_004343196.2 hypothetical protein CAOG_07337 [Capsaspora owczarzaki ATCC 30864]